MSAFTGLLKAGGVVIAFCAVVVLASNVPRKPKADQITPQVDAKALAMEESINAQITCEAAIKAASKNPSSAVIPQPRVGESQTHHQFHWPHGHGLRLQNDFGALIDTTAVCNVDRKTARISSFEMDGEKLL